MTSYHLVMVFLFLAGLMLGSGVFAGLWMQERRRACIDDLTGLSNYRGFLNYLRKFGSRWQALGGYGIALIDIDNFRRFNEQGYQFGDIELKRFASRLQETMQGVAFVSRYRLGDEFVVFFKASCSEAVIQILNGLKTPTEGMASFSFSFGLQVFYDGHKSAGQMIEEVQVLLSQNKGLKS